MEWNEDWTVPTVTGVVSFGLGVLTGAGYMAYKYKPYMAKLEERVAFMQEDLNTLLNDPGPQEGQDTHLLTEEEIPQPEHQEIVIHEQVIEAPRHLVFPHDEGVVVLWDYEAELPNRSPDFPYIIGFDEFEIGEEGFSQSTLTYYEKDDILTDDKDVPIYDRRIVGELKFGHGSNDPNIVYIRNTSLQSEFEILRDSGSFQEIVLGEEIETRLNGDKEEPRKFRPTD